MGVSWLDRFNRTPPIFCRLYAHSREKPLSHAEIARRAGMSKSTVSDLSRRLTWDKVPMRTALRFAEACGVNLLATWRVAQFMKSRKLVYLANAEGNARKMYDRMLRDLDESAAA